MLIGDWDDYTEKQIDDVVSHVNEEYTQLRQEFRQETKDKSFEYQKITAILAAKWIRR